MKKNTSLKHTLKLLHFATLDINKIMRMINGNGNSKVLKVLYQNIPGYTLNNEDIIASIELILDQEKPDVLGIAEPKYNDLERDWDGYTLVKGSLRNGTKIRC